MLKREEIQDKYKWNLKEVYKDKASWEKDFLLLQKDVEKVVGYRGRLNNKDMLYSYFQYSKDLNVLGEKLLIHVYINHLADMDNAEYNAMLAKWEILMDDYSLKSSFVLPELNECSVEYLESLKKDDRFEYRKMAIDDLIRNKKHILSHAEEEIVSQVGTFSGAFSDIYDGFDAVDLKFEDATDSSGEKHELSKSNYGKLLESKDRVLRKNVYENFYKAYENLSSTIVNNYIGSVKKDSFYTKVHKYDSTLQSEMEDVHLTEKFYYKLIENVERGLEYKYNWTKLKKKILGLDIAYPYDMSVPISENQKIYKYEDACAIVKNSLKPMGEDYYKDICEAIDNRWIDVYPTVNKESGGCNIDYYAGHSYILLNYEGLFNDVATIAHELGHAMHAKLTKETQPYEYTSPSLLLCETASTINEVLLYKYMYNHSTDKDEKLYILQEYIGLINAALFGQTCLSEFEDYAHKLAENNEPITKQILLDKFEELKCKYDGGLIEKMPQQKYGFLAIPHLYRSYYVYTYATGVTAGINFVKQCEKGEEGIKNIRKFLSSGCSDYPLNIMRSCGVDLENDESYDVVFEELNWAIEEVSKVIK